MTQEERQLLLKDICARLPYRVICDMWFEENESDKITEVLKCGGLMRLMNSEFNFIAKPYLRPLSSMTEEECITLSKLRSCETDAWKYIKTPIPLYIANIEQFDFFHRHHLDWRGLIHKGLALEASEGMYKTE